MAADEPFVSILMPVYNAGPWLKECLSSVLKQSYSNWELIAVNDFSTDDSGSILNSFAMTDARIRVIDNCSKGIIPALELAFAKSKGQLITRMDADDIMVSDKISALSGALLNSGPGHVATGLVKYFSDGQLNEGYIKYADWLNQLALDERHFSEIYRECVIPSPCWMCYKSDIKKIGGITNNIYPEDYELCFRFKKFKIKPVSVNRILHHWRDHETRTSRTSEHYRDNRFTALKVKYFIDIDYNKDFDLVVWGAGARGKAISQLLSKQKIGFNWITNNPRKQGHIIYGVKLQNSEEYVFRKNTQLIISVAQKGERKQIDATVDKIVLKDSCFSAFYFC